jgi:hypothetical protein
MAVSDARPAGEVLVDYLSPLGPRLTALRGVMLMSYVERLKERGHLDRYSAALSEADRVRLTYITAMSWVPVDLALAHFAACDALNFGERELVEQGGESARTMGPAMLGTLLRAVGTSPLSALSALGRVWDRIHQGGACVAIHIGPKDLFIEQQGNPLSSSRFYRLSGQGFYKSLAELFCTRAYVKAARPTQQDGRAFAVTISWV